MTREKNSFLYAAGGGVSEEVQFSVEKYVSFLTEYLLIVVPVALIKVTLTVTFSH